MTLGALIGERRPQRLGESSETRKHSPEVKEYQFLPQVWALKTGDIVTDACVGWVLGTLHMGIEGT